MNKPRLGERLIRGLTEIRNTVKQGKPLSSQFTCRTVRLDLRPHDHDADSIKRTRLHIGVSQAVFAQILGVSVDTVASWEQGINVPNPMACRFLDEINRDKKHWLRVLRESLVDA
jgi:DNA-binding transcriptional regulator YiaG